MGIDNSNPLGAKQLRAPYFESQVEPKGRLRVEPACHACWYYFMLADKCRDMVGSGPESQIIVQGEGIATADWMDRRYHQIAKSVAMLYGLDSPEDFLPYFPVVQQEADRIGYTVHFDILRPFGVGLLS